MLRPPSRHKIPESNIKNLLGKYRIKPDPLKDQFFLNDNEIVRKVIGYANLNLRDVVLEIGAGTGVLTQAIADKSGKVISFEIDKKFRPFLDKLPKNVELRYENAWDYIQLHGKSKKKKVYNKIVSNLPYSFAEQFLHNLTFLEYDKAILIVPLKFVNKVNENGIFSSFFKAEIKEFIDKDKFFPIPRTNSAVIDLKKIPDPIEIKNPSLFLRQYVYQHEKQLVKNSLVEGIIKYSFLVYSKKVTKNQARKIITDLKIDSVLLEKVPVGSEVYNIISEEFKDLNVFIEESDFGPK